MTYEADIVNAEIRPIEQPKYRCKNGHEEIGTVAFWSSPDKPPVHCCLICWRDWMLAQGWEAVEVTK